MTLRDILQRPIPDMTAARKNKPGYRRYPLKQAGGRSREPLVDIGLYGIAGQSYYSRPNAATSDPVLGVAPGILVRQSVAERLADINYALQQSEEVAELLDGKVELYVNEGYRSPILQKQLYHETFPNLIRKEHPEFSNKEVHIRRDELIGAPVSKDSPSPHATGAAVDVRLRYLRPELGLVSGNDVLMADENATISRTTYPDYYEHKGKINKQETAIRRNRRIFYWVMRGALIEDDSDFVVNPTEWWHWSYGDQLWAQLTNAPEAFFTLVDDSVAT